MSSLKFLVDVCADIRLTQWLREQGYDTIHLRDERLHSLPNGEIFDKAVAESRTVITHDLDFGEICAMTHGRKASVVVFRLHNPRIERLVNRISAVLADCAPALHGGSVVIVEEARHRVRRLPVGSEH